MFPMTKRLKPECQATLSIALVAIVQLQKRRKKHGKSQPFKPYLKALKTEISAFMMQQVTIQAYLRDRSYERRMVMYEIGRYPEAQLRRTIIGSPCSVALAQQMQPLTAGNPLEYEPI